MKMSGQDQTGRSALVFLKFVGGLAIDRETYSSSSTGYFDRNTVQDFVDMERAKMKVTRVCVYM